MSSFKDMVARDNFGVFLNCDEFAEKRTVKYDGATYEDIPIVLSGLKDGETTVTATHGKLSYKVLVMIVPIVTTIVASFGLDTIVSLTSPWFSFFYPITLVMTILGIFEKKIPNDGAFKGAVYFTVIYAVLDLPHEYGFGFLDPVLNHIPLYGLGFGWIVPAIVGFIVGLIAWKGKGRTET